MTAIKRPFRQRANTAIQKSIRQRLYLLGNRLEKNFITADDCKKVQQDISTMQSDRQFARYLVANYDLIVYMPSGRNRNLKATLSNLHAEAQNIIFEPKPNIQYKTTTT